MSNKRNLIIEALKSEEARLCAENKAAIKRCYEDEDKAELRAENVGHNVMMHAAIRIVREHLSGEGE